MRRYLVVTPEMGTVIPILDDGTGPMEYGCDVFECEAENASDAKLFAVQQWRREGAEWIDYCDGNPFAGLVATVMSPCPWCGGYCQGCDGLLKADEQARILAEGA